jgi:hypothetical protein
MGTRSLTVMNDSWEDHKEIVVMYRQMDGYPGGHGVDLAKFLSEFEIVNGIGPEGGKIANGGGCLAAQIVDKFKEGAGGFYLYPAGTRDVGEEYSYFVTPDVETGSIEMKIVDYNDETIFIGTAEEFLALESAEL